MLGEGVGEGWGRPAFPAPTPVLIRGPDYPQGTNCWPAGPSSAHTQG